MPEHSAKPPRKATNWRMQFGSLGPRNAHNYAAFALGRERSRSGDDGPGARGAYQAGVLKRIGDVKRVQAQGNPFAIIGGASAGGIKWFADAAEGAKRAGVRAGFSVPVLDANGNCLGSLASHFRHTFRPTMYDLERQSLFAKLIGFALVKHGVVEYAAEPEARLANGTQG